MAKLTDSKLENQDQEFETPITGSSTGGMTNSSSLLGNDEYDDNQVSTMKQQKERRKIEIKFIQDKSRRHITFSKRKAGIMKKAYELSVLTGTQVLLLVVSETGLVYTFTTPKLQPLVTKSEGKNLIQACLNAPDNDLDDDSCPQNDISSGNYIHQNSVLNNPLNNPSNNPSIQQQYAHQVSQVHRNQHEQMQKHPLIRPDDSECQQITVSLQNPHGISYFSVGNNQQNVLIPPNEYTDSSEVYQQYFSNIQNNNISNQQQFE